MPMCIDSHTRRGEDTGIAFIDATSRVVCHNRRIPSHPVFRKVARRGKTSMGWFDGFKLHLVVNERGELLAFRITPGNVDDRAPMPELTQGLTGQLVRDRGYISQQLFKVLWARGLQLITKIRKNMPNELMPLADKLLLRKRAIIETITTRSTTSSRSSTPGTAASSMPWSIFWPRWWPTPTSPANLHCICPKMRLTS